MEKELWKYLQKTKKPILLYGMGNGADKIIAVLEKFNISFEGVFASDGFVRDKYFHGKKLMSYSEAKEKYKDMIVLLCFGSSRSDVRENVLKISSEQELYAPEVPVVGDGLFCEEYYNENKSEFDEVYEHLADDLSKKTYQSLIKYKLSGKLEYLLECEVSEQEPYDSFLKLQNNEIFLDLGAYTGDTVADFINRVGDYKKIIAAEPDSKNFKKLSLNTEKLKNISLLNVGISDICKKDLFSMKGGRNSTSFKGKGEIEFLNVDKICENDRVTFIKMDVEGEEGNAIIGAKNTILRDKPKMLVSAYHKTDDLISLPKAVFSIRNDYKLYIRHFVSLPAWDTNFYFI
ncbi:MAG: FkbM family methyltransferase [Ruminococcaceae bacterium]|nr:FkbM family methyltransferase [Oscillospiraceae bacterium]